MSEPMYLGGDSVAYSNTSEEVQEVECDCGNLQEIYVQSEYHSLTNEVTWWGEWKCNKCGEAHDSEGWY